VKNHDKSIIVHSICDIFFLETSAMISQFSPDFV